MTFKCLFHIAIARKTINAHSKIEYIIQISLIYLMFAEE